MKNIFKIGILANIFEWYEFCVYGYLAGVIGILFFSENQEQGSVLIKSFFIFAVSYIARPLGSIIFGYFSNRFHLNRVLAMSLIIMTVPAMLIGLLPTYPVIGWYATFSLIFLRLIQGFAAGSELPLSGCYVYENTPKEKQALYCSGVTASSLAGVLLGAIVVFILSSFLSRQALLDWGWRIPFLLSIPLSMIIFRMRYKLTINCKLKPTFSIPIKFNYSLIKLMLIALLIVAVTQVTFYLVFVWMPSYLIYFLHIQEVSARLSNVISLLLSIGFIILWGMMANRITCKNIFIFNMLALACLIIPLFTLLNTGVFTLILISQIVLAFFSSGMNATIVKILADMFPFSIRVLAVSIAFTFGASFFGGTAPMLATFLLHKYHYYWLPAVYIISLVILVFFTCFKIDFLRKLLPRKVSFFRYSLLK